MASVTQDGWFVSTTDRPEARLDLVAFPSAGGGCAVFAEHSRALPGWINLQTLNLPGRQARFGEPLRTNLKRLVEDLTSSCAGRTSPYMFFGYCTGALLAYCVARELQARRALLPELLIIGSFRPPHAAAKLPLADLAPEHLWEILLEHGAVPPLLAQQPQLRELAEPVLLADLVLANEYIHVPGPPLPIPISVIIGQHDNWLTVKEASGWSDYTTRKFSMRYLPTGHWFMEEKPKSAVESLAAAATNSDLQI